MTKPVRATKFGILRREVDPDSESDGELSSAEPLPLVSVELLGSPLPSPFEGGAVAVSPEAE